MKKLGIGCADFVDFAARKPLLVLNLVNLLDLLVLLVLLYLLYILYLSLCVGVDSNFSFLF